MNWLNIETTTLDSEEFVGSEPIARATWLCLLRYCVGQENGGRISDCKGWADRKWQQLARVTQAEVSVESALWKWDGDTLEIWAYPVDKESEVKAKREAGRLGGLSRSEAKLKAVRANGGACWYLMAKDEGHGFQKKKNADFQFLSTIQFWQQHLLAETKVD